MVDSWAVVGVGLTGVKRKVGGILGSRDKLRKAEKEENTWCFGKSVSGSV